MILLDTHAWVRWLHPELGRPLPRSLLTWLENSDDVLAVSVISCLEVAQLNKKGTLLLPLSLPQWFDAALEESEVMCLPVTPTLLHASTQLPDIHRDPADRIIIATAQSHHAVLITEDRTIRSYPGVDCLWNMTP